MRAATERMQAVLVEMGYRAELFSGDELPDRWYGRDEVAELSAEEAERLSARLSEEFARHAGLPPRKSAGVRDGLRGACLKVMARYAEGGAPSIDDMLGDVRSEVSLTESETEALVAWLKERAAAFFGT